MAYATVQDVRTRYSDTISSALDSQVSAYLDDAHANLAIALPDLESRANDDEDLFNATKSLVCRAVMRAISNPLDVSQQSMGGMGVTYRSGGVYFTDRELERLAPIASKPSDYGVGCVHVTSPFMSIQR